MQNLTEKSLMQSFFQIIFRISFFIAALIFCQPALATDYETSLKQKIGQMLMLGFKGTQLSPKDAIIQDIFAQNLGGMVLFSKNPHGKGAYNIANPKQVKELTRSLQAYARRAATQHHNHLYPLLIAVDYEGGSANPLKPKLGFPDTFSAAEIAYIKDEEAANAATQMAATLKRLGLNLDFAPVVDINVNPRNPVISHFNRSFSADPKKVIFYARLYEQAFHQAKILCTFKHFPGHGSSTSDSHHNFVDISHTWKNYELAPYQQLLADPNACDFVMIGHLINRRLDNSGLPATLSNTMISGLLRQQLQFSGIVITDDLQMKAISNRFTREETVRLAINAGADILLFANQIITTPQDAQSLVDMIYADVQNGTISENRINEAYSRIHTLKLRMQS